MAANFEIVFNVEGVGDISLPVTALDDLLVKINGLETKIFRFSVQNILTRDLTVALEAILVGNAASKVGVTFGDLPLSIAAGAEATIEATVVPTAGLVEGDVVAVTVKGTEVV